MKYLAIALLCITLSACATDYTKKEQLHLEVRPELMAPPPNLEKL